MFQIGNQGQIDKSSLRGVQPHHKFHIVHISHAFKHCIAMPPVHIAFALHALV